TEWWYTAPAPWWGNNFDPELGIPEGQQGNYNTNLTRLEFGQEAVAKLHEFFGGLPARVVAQPEITAHSISYGEDAVIEVEVPTTGGHTPSAQVTIEVAGQPFTSGLVGNTATFTVPGIPGGTHTVTATYPGDANLAPATASASLTVARVATTGVSGAAGTVPSSTDGGTYAVTVSTPDGLAAATGTVNLTLVKGGLTEHASGTVTGGSAS